MTALVLLATCNAGPYLGPQLDSIVAQSRGDWQLLVSDDASTDGTRERLRDFAAGESRCEILPPRRGDRGACGNFAYLLAAARDRASADTALYLCDQDDIWEPEKLARQAESLSPAVPACFSDMRLVDGRGRDLRRRFHGDGRFTPPRRVASLLAQNAVAGCSLALRRELLDLAMPFPPGLINHDWWLALCALSIGGLAYIDTPLLRYRQHADNAVGTLRPLRQLPALPRLLARQQAVLRSQAEAARVLGERLRGRQRPAPAALDAYASLMQAPPLSRSRALAFGEFAAPSLPLRCLRAIAALSG
jgi:glycosyltransferase involved in cell wall biosynthesis